MMSTVFLIVALVLFVLAAFNVPGGRINLLAAGLAFWVLAGLIGVILK